jgi:sulfur-carrier protein
MKIEIRFFASLREALGAQHTLSLPEGATVGEARTALVALGGRHAELLATGRAVRCALNQALCDEQATLAEGDELAFFPPVTGG